MDRNGNSDNKFSEDKWKQKLFAAHLVKSGFNGESAYKETFPGEIDDSKMPHRIEKLMKKDYVLEVIEGIKEQVSEEVFLNAGRIIKEHWHQYKKYKNNKAMASIALAHLRSLREFLPQTMKLKELEAKNRSSTVIILPAHSEVGAKVKEIKYDEIPLDLLPDQDKPVPEPEDLDDD